MLLYFKTCCDRRDSLLIKISAALKFLDFRCRKNCSLMKKKRLPIKKMLQRSFRDPEFVCIDNVIFIQSKNTSDVVFTFREKVFSRFTLDPKNDRWLIGKTNV